MCKVEEYAFADAFYAQVCMRSESEDSTSRKKTCKRRRFPSLFSQALIRFLLQRAGCCKDSQEERRCQQYVLFKLPHLQPVLIPFVPQ